MWKDPIANNKSRSTWDSDDWSEYFDRKVLSQSPTRLIDILQIVAFLISGTNQRAKPQFNWDALKGTLTEEYNKNEIHCYFKNNLH